MNFHSILVALLSCLAFASSSSLCAGDKSPSAVIQILDRIPLEVEPLVQEDDFSCGYLALSAIYRSYGLDPSRARLRERLGTSVPAIPFVASSNGTLQPDLIRVLNQDGFRAQAINPIKELSLLKRHLSGPHYVLALVRTEESGGLHWIVLSDFREGAFEIADSLVEGLHWKKEEEFVGPRFLQAILLSPGTPDPSSPLAAAHYEGSRLLLDSVPRATLVGVGLGLLLFIIFVVFALIFLLKKILGKRAASRLASC